MSGRGNPAYGGGSPINDEDENKDSKNNNNNANRK